MSLKSSFLVSPTTISEFSLNLTAAICASFTIRQTDRFMAKLYWATEVTKDFRVKVSQGEMSVNFHGVYGLFRSESVPRVKIKYEIYKNFYHIQFVIPELLHM